MKKTTRLRWYEWLLWLKVVPCIGLFAGFVMWLLQLHSTGPLPQIPVSILPASTITLTIDTPAVTQPATSGEVTFAPVAPIPATVTAALPTPSSPYADIDAGTAGQAEARRNELEYLRPVQPDNLTIPVDKTNAQVALMEAQIQDHNWLQLRIDNNEATPVERERYYGQVKDAYQQELVLLDLCQDVAANSLDTSVQARAKLCTDMVNTAQQRRANIAVSLKTLRQKLLAGDP